MIQINITSDPLNNKFFYRANVLESLVKNGIKTGWHEVGVLVSRETRRLLRTKKRSGRVYNFEGTRIRSSAPGEPPARRTGNLAKSVNYRVRGYQELIIGESAEYAGFMEEGTRRVKPRPHLITAINSKEKDIENTLIKYINKELK